MTAAKAADVSGFTNTVLNKRRRLLLTQYLATRPRLARSSFLSRCSTPVLRIIIAPTPGIKPDYIVF